MNFPSFFLKNTESLNKNIKSTWVLKYILEILKTELTVWEMDEKTVDRIFAGSLVDLPPVSSKIVRIFTSSTFTDMLMERNTLMEWVYPKIREYCREKHGLEFQVNNFLRHSMQKWLQIIQISSECIEN